MRAAINQFRTNIERVRNLGTIYKALNAQTTDILDLSDLLRAELVMAVSAFDHYIHEIVRLGMLEAYQTHRIQTQAFLRFRVTLDNVLQGISTPSTSTWLEDQIRNSHGFQSFQHPDKVADAIRLISNVQLWDEIANHLSVTKQDVKQQLSLIIDRRNKIAHEADIDPSFPGRRWPINDSLVDNSINFIEQLAETIFRIVS